MKKSCKVHTKKSGNGWVVGAATREPTVSNPQGWVVDYSDLSASSEFIALELDDNCFSPVIARRADVLPGWEY